MTQRLATYQHDGLTFDVRDRGPADGEPVLLLHGFPERASHWDGVARRLHEHGYRTLAPDQRGYSPGARPRGRRAYRTDRLVGDVLALADRVGGRVHLVGHDWGAVVAWQAAARHADRIRTLTAVSVAHPTAFARALLSSGQALRSWYVLAFQTPVLPETLAAQGVLRPLLRRAGLSAEEVDRFDREIVAYGALPGGLGWYRALPFSATRRTPTVRVPTTQVWSDGDTALSRRGPELSGDHVRAPYRLEVMDGVSHWVPTHAPDRLADVVLERLRTG